MNIGFIKVFVFIFSVLLLIPHGLESQNWRIERGDQAFQQRHYQEAIEHYDKAFDRVRGQDPEEAARITYRMAVSYSKINETVRAEMWFRRAIRMDYDDPELLLKYAEELMKNEKYEDALEQYKKYAENNPDDPRGEKGIKSVDLTQELKDNPTRHEVEVKRDFNTRRGEDFAPAFGDHRESSVIFTSSRDATLNDDEDPWTGGNYTDLFITYRDRQGDWSNPELIDEGPINTEFNEGTPSLNVSKTELYFTRCVTMEEKDLGCRIYRSQRNGANWDSPSVVELVNDSSITVGHPAISPDGRELYFSSNMPGGVGGKDLWVARRNSVNEEFGRPVNLGPVINTQGNEMFPYVRENGVLYFSSDGHPGMGGLDIFKSEKEDGSWSEPENMGYPINSASDDFAIVFKSGEEKGYFTSNRAGRIGDQIYSFVIPPLEFTLKGTVRDDSTKYVLPGATVQLIGSDGTVAVDEADEDGEYYFDESKVKPDVNYEILASYDNYFSERGQETTVGVERNREFVYDFYLEPIPEAPIALPEILYDFDSWELKPQFQDSLTGLVETLNNNPDIVIELASHTDSRGTHEHNDTLSQRRAQSVVDFLVEKGINPERLEAKGYGQRQPREVRQTIQRNGYTFEAGTVLTEEFINDLPSEEKREVAHQLNRRTEFTVLSEDFDPENGDYEGD